LGTAVYNGTVQEGDGWKKVCSVMLVVPWDVEENQDLPWTWTYNISQYTNPQNKAIWESWVSTHPTIYMVMNEEGPEYEEQTIYPNPPCEDPYNVELSGSTTILEWSSISWQAINLYAESKIRVKDHSGMELEITYSTLLSGESREL